ncbi:helix-turn-helix transcriptional regulator [Mucilaginibacter robiniae]|uniref:Helix-turn-helix transcriptional regulator n=1 Tax=Mucilaginibacter robiniae TaxID=2728022 RepID=A0A7L5E2X3_9SPHI|nr:AraC family transcriptional regulator [Mucilaginibacter robiniae]QJD95994.1 helix-turn-helix transcriptional regulator [Mucilaginibacter robiniae]
MTLHIKNMVCDRCIRVVHQQLENLGLRVSDITLGTAEVHPEPDEEQLGRLAPALKDLGFELISKDKDRLAERIKNIIIELVHHSNLSEPHMNIMRVIADRLNRDYAYLSRLFSENEDITIEKFIIRQKVEKIKELLQYGDLNLNEIAYKMGYSSSAHLSAQFKHITGLSPSRYRTAEKQERKPLDKI